jgi:pyruvyltransferase
MTIKLFWQGGDTGEINFGDTLSPMIVERLSGKPVVFADVYHCDMIAIGSILDKVVKRQWKRLLRMRLNKIKVFGSGSLGPTTIPRHKFLDIVAVRGPMTRDAMNLSPDLPLGDPGILIDRLFPIKPGKEFHWGVIPHVTDQESPVLRGTVETTPGVTVIDLRDPDIAGVVQKIAACEFVVSTSLHGLIAADALGVPHIWTRVSGNIHGGDWKFLDYFKSIGLDTITGPVSIAANTDLRLLESTALLAPRDAIERRKDALISAFANSV